MSATNRWLSVAAASRGKGVAGQRGGLFPVTQRCLGEMGQSEVVCDHKTTKNLILQPCVVELQINEFCH